MKMDSNTNRTVLPRINTQQDVSMHTWKAATCFLSLLFLFQLPTKDSTFILILKHFNLTVHPFSTTQKAEENFERDSNILVWFCLRSLLLNGWIYSASVWMVLLNTEQIYSNQGAQRHC